MVGRLVDVIAEAASDAECDVGIGAAAVSRLQALAHGAGGGGRVSGAAGRRHRAGLSQHGRRQRRPRARRCRAPGAQRRHGTEHNHQPDESVTVEALQTMFDVTLGIVQASG